MDRVRVQDIGVLVPGASRSRVHMTSAGKKQIRFVRSDAEGPFSLASDYLTIAVLSDLGIGKLGIALAELPTFLHDMPELRPVMAPIGLAWDNVPADDVFGPEIIDVAQQSEPRRVLIQYLVLDWMRSEDHRGKNFLRLWNGSGLVAIDFCRAPSREAWECQPIPIDTPDHGGLGSLVRRCPKDLREEVCAQLDSIDGDALAAHMSEMPHEWLAGVDVPQMIGKLLARRVIVRDRNAF